MGLFSRLFGKKKKEENLDQKKDQVLARHADNQEVLKEDARSVTLEDVETDIRTIEAVEPSQIKPEKPKRQEVFETEEKEVVDRAASLKEKEVVDEAPEAVITNQEPVKAYSIKKHAKGWQIIADDAARAYRVFDTQKEAVEFAKENALEVTVYKADGTPRN